MVKGAARKKASKSSSQGRKVFPREFMRKFFAQKEYRSYASEGGLNKKTKGQFEAILSEKNLWYIFEAYAQEAEAQKIEEKQKEENEMKSYSFNVNDILYAGYTQQGYRFVYVEAITETKKLRVRPFKYIPFGKKVSECKAEKEDVIITTITYCAKPDLQDMEKVKHSETKPKAIILRPDGSIGTNWYNYKKFKKYDESCTLDVYIVHDGLD